MFNYNLIDRISTVAYHIIAVIVATIVIIYLALTLYHLGDTPTKQLFKLGTQECVLISKWGETPNVKCAEELSHDECINI